jgi:DNA (cytosine-5)-methyltransferase 1
VQLRDFCLVDFTNAVSHAHVSEKRFSFVSLYSGAGGLDLGFSAAGFYPVWANDIDPDAVETYNNYLGGLLGHEAVCGDVRRQALPECGSAALVIGGPPCQGFSVAGKMDPNDPRSRHIWDFLGVVKRVQPRAFVLENVMGLAMNRRWAGLRHALLQSAGELGYETELITLRASDFGVPQNRERMFLVGTRNGEAIDPEPVSAEAPPTVRSVLDNLPRYGASGNRTFCVAKVTPAKKPVLRRSPYAGMLFNGQGRPLNLDAPAPTLPASMGGNRTPIIDQEQLDTGRECWVIGYHRRLWNGGAPYKRVPKRLRRLTLEECAAIQTFPPGVEWSGRLSSQFKQIGNAVPPRLAFHVALALRRALGLGSLPSTDRTDEHARRPEDVEQVAA